MESGKHPHIHRTVQMDLETNIEKSQIVWNSSKNRTELKYKNNGRRNNLFINIVNAKIE